MIEILFIYQLAHGLVLARVQRWLPLALNQTINRRKKARKRQPLVYILSGLFCWLSSLTPWLLSGILSLP